MAIITLMTDFGIKDGNVGVMKGVIYGIAPQAHIVDLSHLIGAQNVKEAGFVLSRSAPYFPAGTVHIVVVDPGVGTNRRPIAARIGDQYFVGPDNGLLTFWRDIAERTGLSVTAVHLNRPRYWLADVSFVFHGRDIFSPVGAHLANGTPLEELGDEITDLERTSFPAPAAITNGLRGEVVHIDHFGNVSSNITIQHVIDLVNAHHPSEQGDSDKHLRKAINQVLEFKDHYVVTIGNQNLKGLVSTFGEKRPGEPVALFGSTGTLVASVVNGSYAQEYQVRIGQPFTLRIVS